MSRPVPLMFINSPSTSIRYSAKEERNQTVLAEEESTDKMKDPSSELQEELVAEGNETNPFVVEQLKKMQTPFGRHLYQPLQFNLVNQSTVIGTLKEIQDGKLTVLAGGNEEKVLTIDAHEITDILWRGKSIKE